jgi:hypothetical protein
MAYQGHGGSMKEDIIIILGLKFAAEQGLLRKKGQLNLCTIATLETCIKCTFDRGYLLKERLILAVPELY